MVPCHNQEMALKCGGSYDKSPFNYFHHDYFPNQLIYLSCDGKSNAVNLRQEMLNSYLMPKNYIRCISQESEGKNINIFYNHLTSKLQQIYL